MDPGPNSDLTIVLLGNTGVGKSASGNTILGCQAFESAPSFKSVTKIITEATETVFDRQISVIDTPGIFHAKKDIIDRCQELLQSSRRCLFLVTVSVGRFTEEQEKALKATVEVLEAIDALKRSILLFTNGDALTKMSLDNFIFEDEEGSLPDIVKKFTGNYHLFNNVNGGQEQVKQLLIKSDHLQTGDQGSPASTSGVSVRLKETRIVLLGLPGGGKSSSGNTILGSEQFKTESDFESVSADTVSKSAEVAGRRVTVVDTPGFSDEVLTPEQLYMEIMRSITEASPGPHAFVLVVRVGRMSRADSKLLQLLPQLFGNDAQNYAMVLFTHGDELGGQSIDEKMQSSTSVKELVSMCDNRYCVFDNRGRKSRWQVQNFMKTIDDMVTANRGKNYTSDMFEMANTFIIEAERDQQDQTAGTDETPRETAQSRLEPFFRRTWLAICMIFTACCCCVRPHTLSDDERAPLVSTNPKTRSQV